MANFAAMRGGASTLVLVLCLFGALRASAAEIPALDLRRFSLPADEAGALFGEPVHAPGPLNWNAALVSSYATRLVVLEDATGTEVAVPVRHQLSLDYVFAIGLGDRVALGLVLPSVLYQAGDSIEAAVPGAGPLPTSALGDVGLSAKAVLLPAGDLGGFAVGAVARVTLPTGDSASYVSEGSATGELRLLSELNLVALSLRATAGAKVRGEETRYVGQAFGHELPWGAAIVLRPQALGWDDKGRWSWAVESHGALALTPSFGAAAGSPAQIGALARYTPSQLSFLAGFELPLNSAVGVPALRTVVGVGWAPRFNDADSDGIEDEKDECAELAEDRDGFQDGDGCPDFDNDDDGVGDDTDRCPAEKEDADGFEDEDGCLDPDDDHDGILDPKDACPREPGRDSADVKLHGCAPRDKDMDGVYEPDDQCPKKAEDRDGFEDTDGCPDPDNDQDKVLDKNDACPGELGIQREDPKLSGCPRPDKDGDAVDDTDDKCPDLAETYDGFEDGDGCPDLDEKNARAALVRRDEKSGALLLRVALAFEKAPQSAVLTAGSEPTLRAIARLLNHEPTLTLLVGVKPKAANAAAEQEALNRAAALVLKVRSLTHRDDVAESVSWASVSKLPGAASGVALQASVPAPRGKP